MARQPVGEGLVEHVISHLAGEIAVAAESVPQMELEATEARLVVGGDRDAVAAAAIVLAVQREVILENEYGESGWRVGRGLGQDGN